MWEWLKRFFFYFKNGTNVSTYSDGLGEGSFGWRHFVWMALVIIIAIGGYLYFTKHPKSEKPIVITLVAALFVTRLFHQTTRAIIGAESPWTQAFPFHMCTVLTFVLPLVLLFDWKAIKTPVYVLSIMGGVITLLLGEYFDDRFMTFWTLEGMSAHTILIIVPIWEIAAGRFTLKIKSAWQVVAGMLVLMSWATLANYVFFPNSGANYMYLVTNALPFGTQQNFFFFYILIFLLFMAIIYGLPVLLSAISSLPAKSRQKKIS